MAELAQLGKIAGIGGIALGAMVLIVRGVLPRMGAVPAKQRAALYNLVIAGAFGIGALGIVAWMLGGQPVPTAPSSSGPTATTTGAQSPAIVGSGATVTYGTPPAPAPAR